MRLAPIPEALTLADVALLHIPDGFLSLLIALFCWLLALGILTVAVRRASRTFDERLAPLAGVMAAFIFAGQLINFPVAGGTSGHLIGATLAFVVLGPWVGLLAMTAVIVLQALLFQDGGLVVMGANILVMGIVPGAVGYGIVQLARARTGRWATAVIGLGAWLSVVVAALITAILLGFSGTTSLVVAIPTMLGIHALIGLGEAFITVAALGFIRQTRPSVLPDGAAAGGRRWVVGGLLITLAVVGLAPLASALPDGLEWVAGEQGFLDAAQPAPLAILPDYTIPGLGQTGLSTILAGVVGVLLVGGITAVVARNLRARSPN